MTGLEHVSDARLMDEIERRRFVSGVPGHGYTAHCFACAWRATGADDRTAAVRGLVEHWAGAHRG